MHARQLCLTQIDALIEQLTQELTALHDARQRVADEQTELVGVLIERTVTIAGVELNPARLGHEQRVSHSATIRSGFMFDGTEPQPVRHSPIIIPGRLAS